MSLKFIALLCFVALASAAPQAAQKDICRSAPVADAPCTSPNQKGLLPKFMYYYDAVDHDCEKILYTGCGATGNLFPTENACEVACEPDSTERADFAQKEVCRLPLIANATCSVAQEKAPVILPKIAYYYDGKTRDCERILYTGCGGSANLFPTERECEAVCDPDDK